MKSHRLSHDTIITGVVLIIAAAALTLDSWVYFQIRNYITVQLTRPTTEIQTAADWQTYTDTDYGFSLKYPKDWHIWYEGAEEGMYLTIGDYPSESPHINSFGLRIQIDTDLESYDMKRPNPSLRCTDKQDINISNYHAISYKCTSSISSESFERYLLSASGSTFDILIATSPNKNAIVYKKILSTFRFTDDMSDWQTYTNDKADYTFTYPKSWVADDCGSNGQMIHITPTAIPCGADWYGNGFVVTKLKNKAERDQMIAQEKKSLSNFQKTDITLAGKPAIRTTGMKLKTPANGEMNLPNDSPSDQLFVTNNGTEYFIMNQTFAISSPYAKEFETFLSTFRFTDDVSDLPVNTDTSPLCTAKPVSNEIGSEIYPSDAKYQKLTGLGPIFTAYKCSSSRLNAVLGNSNGQYTLGSTVWLKTAPSQQLLTTLKAVGYLCSEKVSDTSCKKWRLVRFVNVTDIMKLEPFSEQLEADDCVFCG